MLPCPFCACLPFVDSSTFETHFDDVHRITLFPDSTALCGSDGGLSLAKLIFFYERFQPHLRYINIKLSSLIGCEAKTIKNFEKTCIF